MVTPTREISEVGVGTTVTVLLPRSLCAAVVKSLAASQAPVIRADGSRCGRLLLVEDDREVAETHARNAERNRLRGHPRI